MIKDPMYMEWKTGYSDHGLVCEEKRYTSFQRIYVVDGFIYGELSENILVCFDVSETIKITCYQSGPDGILNARISASEDCRKFSSRKGLKNLIVGGESLWQYGDMKAESISLFVDAGGKAISAQLSMSFPGKHIFGTGERFDSVDQRGKGSSGLVEERCFYQEEVTYIPIPFFFTEKGYGCLSLSTVPVCLKFGRTAGQQQMASASVDAQQIDSAGAESQQIASASVDALQIDSAGAESQQMASASVDAQQIDSAGAEPQKMDSAGDGQQQMASAGDGQQQINSAGAEPQKMDAVGAEPQPVHSADAALQAGAPINPQLCGKDSENTIILTMDASPKSIFSLAFPWGTPAEMIRSYYRLTGWPVKVPDWVFGVWLSANGWNRQEEVYEVLEELKQNDYPASVLVLEAWSDESTYYNWDAARFPNHRQMLADAKAAGLHTLLWQISAIRKDSVCEKEALEKGYCIKNQDGSPYRIPSGWCQGQLVMDFSNPDARAWWFASRKKLLEEGVEGFKTDGGEFILDKTVTQYDGLTGPELCNVHTLQYQKAYQDFMKENGVDGVTFSRSGFTGAQCVPIHWAGDQSSEWRELKGQLTAGISAGLSGIIFWGFDIGALGGPLPNKELYLRSTAFACFCPVMQWHSMVMPDQFAPRYDKMSYNDRSPWNLARQFGDKAILEIAADFARLRHSLIPYIKKEAAWCVDQGRPLMAQLCIDFPADEKAWEAWDEYMFGRELLVAPIYTEGADGRSVYLPEGQWEDFFDGTIYDGCQEIYLKCSLNRVPVFRRKS